MTQIVDKPTLYLSYISAKYAILAPFLHTLTRSLFRDLLIVKRGHCERTKESCEKVDKREKKIIGKTK